jgi:hypothetical protein
MKLSMSWFFYATEPLPGRWLYFWKLHPRPGLKLYTLIVTSSPMVVVVEVGDGCEDVRKLEWKLAFIF